jgi:membrane associated rhomboid family serine protease
VADPPRPDDEEYPAWIDRVAGWAAAVGLNRVRVRWKLQRWHNQRRLARNRREQKALHVGYQHKVCPKCTAVNDRDDTVCSRCGEALHSRPRELLGRLGLRGPVAASMSTLIALMLLAVYVRTVVASGAAGGFSIPIRVLVLHGGNLPDGWGDDEWWRFATAVFLHAGIWHIAFNVISLSVVGPMVEEEFGRWMTMFLFMVTGIAASIGTRQLGLDGVGIGASGALCGLIGATAAAGQRAGTPRGRHLRNDMLKWFAYVVIFGFLIGADNRAHAVGFLAGAALGLLVPPRWRTLEWLPRIGVALGVLGLAAALVAVYLTMVPPPVLTLADMLAGGWPE